MEISRRGARLAWLSGFRGPGDTVELQYGREKARYRVVWVGAIGTGVDNQVGLWALEPKKYIWGLPLPAPIRVDDAAPPAAPNPQTPFPKSQEQRHQPRYHCMGGVEIRPEGTESSQSGTLAEIGLGGCYIETEWPLPERTRVEVLLRLAGLEIHAKGVVGYQHPSFGMGVIFAHMDPADRKLLEQATSHLRPLEPN